jgi:hypothetical protein
LQPLGLTDPVGVKIPRTTASTDGLFTRADCRAHGIAYSTVRRGIEAGEIVEVEPGVLALRDWPDSYLRRVRAVVMSTGAVASHWSAMSVLRLSHDHRDLHATQRPSGGVVHVIAQRSVGTLRHKTVVHRLPLVLDEVRSINGILVTNVQRTCADLLAMLPLDQARPLAFRARQQRWLDSDDIDRAIQRRGRTRGVGTLRELRPIFDANAHSVAEWMFADVMRAAPEIEWDANVPIRGASGERYVLDGVVRGMKLGIEIDGRAFHSRERFAQDRRRQNDLVAAGWTIIRFTWDDLVHHQDRVRDTVRTTAALLAAAG